MKQFKYFGRTYDATHEFLKRVRKDLLAIGVFDVDLGLGTMDYGRFMVDPIRGPTWVSRGPQSWRIEAMLRVHPKCFRLIDFKGPYKHHGRAWADESSVNVPMVFECHNGQPFELVAFFLMQNNGLPEQLRALNLEVKS